MTRLLIVCVFCLVGCKTEAPKAPDNAAEPVKPNVEKPEKPKIPVTFIDVKDRPTRGSVAEETLVTVVEVGDYGCPDTLEAEAWMAKLLDRTPTARWYYAPAAFEKRAAGLPMTELATTGLLEGKFWETHDLIWKNFKKTDETTLGGMKETLGFDDTKTYEQRPKPHGNELYESLHLTWVPTFFVNGVPYFGETPEPLFELVAQQEEFAKSIMEETGLRGDALYAELVKRNTP